MLNEHPGTVSNLVVAVADRQQKSVGKWTYRELCQPPSPLATAGVPVPMGEASKFKPQTMAEHLGRPFRPIT